MSRPQLGTLGSGNHFLEVQYVVKILDEKVARFLGWRRGDCDDPLQKSWPGASGVHRLFRGAGIKL